MYRYYVLILGILTSLILGQTAVMAEIPVGGSVTGPEGLPFPEARVTLLPEIDPVAGALMLRSGKSPEPAATAVTDSRGYFMLDAPGAGIWKVRVEAEGFLPMEHGLHPLLAHRHLPAVALRPDEGFEVRVVAGGDEPVPAAWVRLSRSGDRSPRFFRSSGWSPAARTAITGEDGTAFLPRSADERLSLSVSAPGYRVAKHAAVRGTAVTSRLKGGPSRTVLVLSPDGKPFAGAMVTDDGGNVLGFTAGDGTLSVVPPGGGFSAMVITEDGRRVDGRVAPASKQEERPRTFTLPESVSVRGRVIDLENRAPVAGGVVWNPFAPYVHAVTDRSGGYEIRGFPGAMGNVLASARGYLRSESADLDFDPEGRPGPTIALQPAAAIEGTVVDGSGNPVPGAKLSMEVKRAASGMMEIRIGGPPSDLPGTLADSRGRYRLEPVDAERNYTVTASMDGYASTDRDVVGLEPRRTVSGVRLELFPGMIVEGTVVDPSGAAVPDVEISLEPGSGGPGSRGHHMVIMGGGGSKEKLTGWTDGDGTFVIPGVGEGTYDLEGVRTGFAKLRTKGLEVPESPEPVDLGEFILEPGTPLQGMVTDDDGRPIENVEIRVTRAGGGMMFVMAGPGPRGDDPEPDAVSGPDGWFTVHDLEKEAAYNVSLARSGFVRATENGVAVPQSEPLAVTMQAASDVSGTVIGPEGEPIPGATVNLTRTMGGGGGGQVFQMLMRIGAVTDDEGHFLFEDQEPGTISLSAVATGWQEAKIDALEIPTGEDLEGVELPLEPGAILTGQVLAPDGRPAVNARIREVSGKSSPVEFLEDSAGTDGDGYYRLEGLAPGELTVEANHPNHVRTVKDVEISPGVTVLDFQFEGGQRISGMAVDSGAAPVPGAFVELLPSGQRWGGPNTLTGADGRFTFEGVSDGEYTLKAEADGHAPYLGEDPVRVAGEPVDGLRAELGPASTIAGRITGLDPAKFHEVRVEGVSRETGFRDSGVDREGNYRLDNVGSGEYRLTATVGSSGRQANGRVRVEPGATETRLDLSFGDGLTLTGRAVVGEAPVKGAMVFAQGTDIQHSGSGRTDNKGEFSVEGLEPGTYRVELRKWDTGLSYDETVELTTSREIVLRVPTARVAGRVVDSVDREPLAGVRVELSPVRGEPSGPFPAHAAVTDLDGAFTIGNVPDGSWILGSNKKGYAAGSLDVAVVNGRDRDDLRVEMDPTEGLTLQVRHASGSIPDSVQVAVLDPTGRAVTYGTFATGENGRVRMTSVPAGNWDLVLGAAGSAYTRADVRAPGGPVAVSLPQACRLRIEVPALAGSNVTATATLIDSRGRSYLSLGWLGSPQGTFRLGGGVMEIGTLPPDSWTVRVAASDGRAWEGTATTSPGGPNRVVLE